MIWKKCIVNFGIALAFLLGLGFLIYPKLSNSWNTLHSSYVIAGYEDEVDDMGQKECNQLRSAAQSYNQSLIGCDTRWEISAEQHQKYMKLLNITDSGVMGYLEIPSIEVSLPIYHTTEDSYLQIGAGHLEGSSLPVGGASTHCVIVGHRGLPAALLFTRLDELDIGDQFYLSCLGEKLTYTVDEITETDPDDFSKLEIYPDKDYCTLLTCTPYGINTSRLLVRGIRVETQDDMDKEGSGAELYKRKCVKTLIIFALCGFAVITVFLLYKKKKRQIKKRK